MVALDLPDPGLDFAAWYSEDLKCAQASFYAFFRNKGKNGSLLVPGEQRILFAVSHRKGLCESKTRNNTRNNTRNDLSLSLSNETKTKEIAKYF